MPINLLLILSLIVSSSFSETQRKNYSTQVLVRPWYHSDRIGPLQTYLLFYIISLHPGYYYMFIDFMNIKQSISYSGTYKQTWQKYYSYFSLRRSWVIAIITPNPIRSSSWYFLKLEATHFLATSYRIIF